MSNENLIEKLTDLAQLDIDAVHAYEEALKNIDDKDIYENIDGFRKDHIRHIDNLSLLIRKYDGQPPERTKDFKGYLIQGFTTLRSVTGTMGALKAMETNEELTNKTYKNALDENNIPKEMKDLLSINYEDEKRHLEYIRSAIKTLEKAS